MSNISVKLDITRYIFCWDLYKDDTVEGDLEDCCSSNVENENTLAIEMRTYFAEVAIKRGSSNFCLEAIEII